MLLVAHVLRMGIPAVGGRRASTCRGIGCWKKARQKGNASSTQAALRPLLNHVSGAVRLCNLPYDLAVSELLFCNCWLQVSYMILSRVSPVTHSIGNCESDQCLGRARRAAGGRVLLTGVGSAGAPACMHSAVVNAGRVPSASSPLCCRILNIKPPT